MNCIPAKGSFYSLHIELSCKEHTTFEKLIVSIYLHKYLFFGNLIFHYIKLKSDDYFCKVLHVIIIWESSCSLAKRPRRIPRLQNLTPVTADKLSLDVRGCHLLVFLSKCTPCMKRRAHLLHSLGPFHRRVKRRVILPSQLSLDSSGASLSASSLITIWYPAVRECRQICRVDLMSLVSTYGCD